VNLILRVLRRAAVRVCACEPRRCVLVEVAEGGPAIGAGEGGLDALLLHLAPLVSHIQRARLAHRAPV
jgi:hypothetical protein